MPDSADLDVALSIAHMNDAVLPPKPKAAGLTQRLFPGRVVSGLLIVLLVIVLYLRITHEENETGWLDQAGANLATYAAVIISSIALWSWFSFRSTYPTIWRRAVMLAGLAGMVFVVSSVRLDGLSGNWVPLGWRWSWQQPRDYARAKPVAASSVDSTGDNPKDQIQPATPVESTLDDFPQFLGPNRDGHLPDVQLSHDWQATPPEVVWQKEIGSGWSGFAVVGDYAVTLEQYGDEEFVTCRDLATGETRWSHAGRHFRPEHVANLVHLQALKQPLHPVAELILGQPVQPAEVFDHLPGRHPVIDTRVARDKPDLPPHLGRLRDNVEAIDSRLATGGLQHGAENP